MRTVYDTRRDNLRALIGQWGGPTSLSKKLGHANGSYIALLADIRRMARLGIALGALAVVICVIEMAVHLS